MKNYYVLVYHDNHFVNVINANDYGTYIYHNDNPKPISKDDAMNLTDKLRKFGHQAFMSELPIKNYNFNDYVTFAN